MAIRPAFVNFAAIKAFRGVDEIVERVGPLGELPVEEPLVAKIVAAADMRDCAGPAAVEQAYPVGVERRRDRMAVGAIGVEEELAFAVLLEPLAINDRDRHLHAVASLDHQPLGPIGRRIIARRYFLDLQNLELVARGMIVIDRGRRDHG